MIKVLQPRLPNYRQLEKYLRLIDESGGRYTNFGPLTAELEARIGKLTDAPYCVAVSSGTSGLELALAAAQVRGKRVLIPAFTYIATATAVLRSGNVPVLADVDPLTWQLTPKIAWEMAGQYDAIMPVAAMGRPVELSAWASLRYRDNTPIIVDAAAAVCGQQVTGDVDAVVFSLHATKPISSAEGGIVATRSGDVYEAVKKLSCFGDPYYSSGNAKMSEYHAAIALTMLDEPAYTAMLEGRAKLYSEYEQEIWDELKTQLWAEGAARSMMPVLLPRYCNTEMVQKRLWRASIETRRWYFPSLDVLLNHRTTQFPVTAMLSRSLLGLPFHAEMTMQDVHRIGNELRRALQ